MGKSLAVAKKET